MATMNKTVIVGQQAGKTVLTGVMTAHELVLALRDKSFRVNPDAQRSLVSGSHKASTDHLLATDKVEKTPRMQSFIKFCERVMDQVEKGHNDDGFFGAPQFVIPAEFKGAKLESLDVHGVPDQTRIMVLRANPSMGESVIHIGDGQGRAFGFHSLERSMEKQVTKLQEAIKKKERAYQDAKSDQSQLKALEAQLRRVRLFLSKTSLPFVCYVDHVDEKTGVVHGISLEGERRLYIEGNALNARAAQEDIVKYEYFSPVIIALQELRSEDGMVWMWPDYIEEDTKSISRSSTKLFTLSALAQAYSLSIIGDSKPMKRVDAATFETVEARRAFCTAFWQKASQVFAKVWVPDPNQLPAERLEYLRKYRDEDRNVLFSAIFLQALGQVGQRLGEKCEWEPDAPLLATLDKLDPTKVDYRAALVHDQIDGELLVDEWNAEWTNAMMKATVDDDGHLTGYSFNNVADSIAKTRNVLLRKLGIGFEEAATDEAA